MGGDHGRSAVGVSQEMVTASHPDHLESHLGERHEQFVPDEARQARHDANRTRCTPTKFSVSPGSPLKLPGHALLAHRMSVIRQECGEDNGDHGETQPTRSAHHLHPAEKKQAAEVGDDRPDH